MQSELSKRGETRRQPRKSYSCQVYAKGVYMAVCVGIRGVVAS